MSDNNTTNSITREEVYDIVRDSIGIPNQNQLPPNPPTCDAQMPTMEYLRKRQAEQTQFQVGGFIAPPPVCDIDPAHTEARHWYLDKCINMLQEANRIRHDEVLMKEIRAFIRQKRDEAADLLDNIG